MTFTLQMIAVFCLSLIVDIFWTKYKLATGAHATAFWSMMIVLGGTFSTQIWLDNRWTVLAGAAGAYLGTWWTVWMEKRSVQKRDAAK